MSTSFILTLKSLNVLWLVMEYTRMKSLPPINSLVEGAIAPPPPLEPSKTLASGLGLYVLKIIQERITQLF
jgi:hypothetical protein